MDEWVSRIQGKNFHGGDRPDAADFRLFAVLDRVCHTSTVINLLKQRQDPKFQLWFDHMGKLCRQCNQL
jgi:hypothetical protein